MLKPDILQQRLNTIDKVEPFVNAGGQKVVYPCSIGSDKFALKVIELPPITTEEDEANRDSIRLRVLREIEIMRQFDSPHLVRPGPIGLEIVSEEEKDYFCFTEEWIEGQNLAEYCDCSGNLGIAECLTMAAQVSKVISELWNKQLLHRDISMKNIMIRDSGGFVLIDLGYAFDFLSVSLTLNPGPPGTIHYMAPERFDLGKKRDLDHRSDQFSLGVVSYCALTGAHPFLIAGMSGEDYVYNLCNGHESPTKPSSRLTCKFPESLDRLIMRLIARRPHLRYQSCDAACDEIQSIVQELEE